MTKKVYLKSDVYFEPLFNKWFMWPYLLAPATAAMNVANHHVKLLKSYVANAKIHAKSASKKSMAGSSLVNIPVERVSEVKALLDKTRSHYADLIDFSNAVKVLDDTLRSEANGMSLEPLYQRIPENLRGLVELHYDINNQPSFRFIESLLYQSNLFKWDAQTVCLGTLHSAERPFVLSTPRLPDDNHLHINVPLNNVVVEKLFAMRDEPAALDELKSLMAGLDVEGGLDFDSLFTETPPSLAEAYAGDDIRINYLGHAGLMIESNECTILVDPVIAYTNDDIKNKKTFNDIPPYVDYVLLTHTHMDHVCLETLVQLKHKIGKILVPKNNSGLLADPSIKLMLKALGFRHVEELEDLESVAIPGGHIVSLPFLGEHADVNVRSKSAWLVDIKGNNIMAAADSSNLDELLYKKVHKIVGDVDLLFIGMECKGGPLRWLYGPLLTQAISSEENQSRRFNGSDSIAASDIARAFAAKQVYVYALGLEPWFGYFMGISYNEGDVQLLEAQKLIDQCRARDVVAEQLEGSKTLFLASKAQRATNVMF